jgi:hypothetical protein
MFRIQAKKSRTKVVKQEESTEKKENGGLETAAVLSVAGPNSLG